MILKKILFHYTKEIIVKIQTKNHQDEVKKSS